MALSTLRTTSNPVTFSSSAPALTGLCAAIGLARAGFPVVSCGASRPARPWPHGRTARPLDRLPQTTRRLARYRAPRSAAALAAHRRRHGRVFAPRPVAFHADEIDLEAFGWNIENAVLADALAAGREPPDQSEPHRSARSSTSISQADARGCGLRTGARFAPRLVVGADGRSSPARKAAGIDARTHRYPQSALTVFLRHTPLARGLFDRVPHPRGPVHPRSACPRRRTRASARASSG